MVAGGNRWQHRPIWVHLGPSGSIWAHLGPPVSPSGSIWAHLGPHVLAWAQAMHPPRIALYPPAPRNICLPPSTWGYVRSPAHLYPPATTHTKLYVHPRPSKPPPLVWAQHQALHSAAGSAQASAMHPARIWAYTPSQPTGCYIQTQTDISIDMLHQHMPRCYAASTIPPPSWTNLDGTNKTNIGAAP